MGAQIGLRGHNYNREVCHFLNNATRYINTEDRWLKIRSSKKQLNWQEINLWNRVSFIDLICKGSISNYSAIFMVLPKA